MIAERDHHFGRGREAAGLAARVGGQLRMQLGQSRVARGLGLAMQPGQQVGAPFGQVGDARGHAVRVQAEAQHVDGRLEQLGFDVRG